MTSSPRELAPYAQRLVLGLALASALGLSSTLSLARGEPNTVRETARSHLAQAAAEGLLGKVRLPVGAQKTTGGSPALECGAASSQGPARKWDEIVAEDCWHVPGEPEAVIAWIAAHDSRGSSNGRGTTSGPNGTTSWDLLTAFTPRQPNLLASEELDVSTAAAAGGGTLLQATATVGWLPARPASERIPQGVKLISVSARARIPAHVSVSQTITKARLVKSLIGTIEHLDRPGRAPHSCPAELPGELTLQLKFLASPGTVPLAKVIAKPGGCGDVRVWIHERQQPALEEPQKLVERTEELIRTKL